MKMNMKVNNLRAAYFTLASIMNDPDRAKVIPQKLAYRVARMHSALKREFEVSQEAYMKTLTTCEAKEGVMRIKVEGEEGFKEVPDGMLQVPKERMDEWKALWNPIGDDTVEVDIEPIPLQQFDPGDDKPALFYANEISNLGELVTDGAAA